MSKFNYETGKIEKLDKAEKRTAQQQKEIDDKIMIPFGERGQTRPKSLGRSYHDEPENRTDQTEKDSCDINNIMKRYEKTGLLEELIQEGMANELGMQYGDFTDAPTFQEALNITNHAVDQFKKLDAHVRNRFDNDPAKFLAFMSEEKNKDEIYTMGLAKRQEQKEPEITLKDVNETLKKGLHRPKPAGKGVGDDDA